MNWLHQQLLKTKPYARFINRTKEVVLPIFGPLPVYTVAAFFFKEISKDALVNKASSLAYNFMLAIFPAIIFLFTLIPYIPKRIGFQDGLISLIALILPTNAFLAFESTLKEIVNIQNGKLLSLGFILSLFFATNGIHRLMKAFNKASLLVETRSWLKQRFIATLLTFVIVLSVIICIAAMGFGEYIIYNLKEKLQIKASFVAYIVQFVRWAIMAVLYFITISIIYRYGPAHVRKWKLFSAGAWLATILAFLTIGGFSFYINHFGSYNKIYGSIGTLIVVMIWLYLNSLILLIGFELNVSVDLSKKNINIIHPNYNQLKKKIWLTKKRSKKNIFYLIIKKLFYIS